MDKNHSCVRVTEATVILQASHTHLYRGHRGKVFGLSKIADMQTGCDCLVEFSDGSAAAARISRADRDWQLQISAYRTVAGTNIAEGLWLVRLHEDGDHLQFHIVNKVPGQ